MHAGAVHMYWAPSPKWPGPLWTGGVPTCQGLYGLLGICTWGITWRTVHPHVFSSPGSATNWNEEGGKKIEAEPA